MKKKFVACFLTLVFIISSVGSTHATSTAELQAQIDALMAQLRAQNNQQTPLNHNTCFEAGFEFKNDLTLGSVGTEVALLQEFLRVKGHFTDTTVAGGYFGPSTQVALAKYQAAKGIAPAAGYFGLFTRRVINAECKAGQGSVPSQSSVWAEILSPNGGERFEVGAKKNVSFKVEGAPASAVAEITLNAGVDQAVLKTLSPIPSSGTTEVTFDKVTVGGDAVYDIPAGPYRVGINVYDKAPCYMMTPCTQARLLASDQSRSSIHLTSDEEVNEDDSWVSEPEVELVNPKGGERYRIGSPVQIKFEVVNIPSGAVAVVSLSSGPVRGVLDAGEINGNGYFDTTLDAVYEGDTERVIRPGQYKFKIAVYEELTSSGPQGLIAEDISGFVTVLAALPTDTPIEPNERTDDRSKTTDAAISVVSQSVAGDKVQLGNNLTVQFGTTKTGVHNVYLVHSATGRATDIGTYRVNLAGRNSFTRTLTTTEVAAGHYKTRVCYGYGASISACADSRSTVELVAPLTSPTWVPVQSPTPSVVTIVTPNGGQTLTVGETIDVKWNYTGVDADQRVTLAVFKNGRHLRNIATGVRARDGQLRWTIPEDTYDSGSIYQVYIGATTVNGTQTDYSDSTFSIRSQAPVEFTFPTGTSQLLRGAWYTIQLKNLPSNVYDIEIYHRANGNRNRIASFSRPQSSYQWTIPPSATLGRVHVLEVVDKATGRVLATSDFLNISASAGETVTDKRVNLLLPNTTINKPDYEHDLQVPYEWSANYSVERSWFQLINSSGEIKNAGSAGTYTAGGSPTSRMMTFPAYLSTGTYTFKVCDVTTGGVSATSPCDSETLTITSQLTSTQQTQAAAILESIKALLEQLR